MLKHRLFLQMVFIVNVVISCSPAPSDGTLDKPDSNLGGKEENPKPGGVAASDDSSLDKATTDQANSPGAQSNSTGPVSTEDNLTTPNIQMSGYPTGINRILVFKVSITGAHKYRYKLGPASTTNCAESVDYGSERDISEQILADISAIADGQVRVCAVGRNIIGWQEFSNATGYTWTKDTLPPLPVSSLTASDASPSKVNISWQGNFEQFIVVRSQTTAVNWSPGDGQSYELGPLDNLHSIVYVGSETTFNDNTVATGINYHYAVFSFDQVRNYSTSTTISATTHPGTPVFNANAAYPSRNIMLSSIDSTGATEMMVSDNSSFVGGIWVPIAESSVFPAATTCSPSRTIYVKARIYTAESSVASALVSIDCTPVAAPILSTQQASWVGEALLSWTPVSDATLYNVYYKNSEGVSYTSPKISGVTSPYKIGGLTPGITYYFRVVASNSFGESNEMSNEASRSATELATIAVDEAPESVNARATIKVETNGTIHVAYSRSDGIFYASTANIENQFSITQAVSGGGCLPEILLDSGMNPMIGYFTSGNEAYLAKYNSGSGWSAELAISTNIINPCGVGLTANRWAVDSSNTVYVGYDFYDGTNNLTAIKRRLTPGTWSDWASSLGSPTYISLKTLNSTLYMSHRNNTSGNQGVFYGVNTVGSFAAVNATDYSKYADPTLVLAGNSPSIISTMWQSSPASMGLQIRTAPNGVWTGTSFSAIDQRTTPGWKDVRAASDVSGNLYIALFDDLDDTARLYTNRSGTWTSINLGSVRRGTMSIDVDNNGRPFIVVNDSATNKPVIKYIK
jgi:hypothetical protein